MSDFLYEKEMSPFGIEIESISGAEEKSAKVWKLFAYQILSEADGEYYRMIDHLDNGAPVLEGVPQRISISHTEHFLVVATLPKTPDIDLDLPNLRTAMGVDAERCNRRQVLNVKERYLTEEEKKLLPPVEDDENASESDIERYIQAWTCKEAIYKAVMGEVKDWQNDCIITRLPSIADTLRSATVDKRGSAKVTLKDGFEMDLTLSSWRTDGHIVTLAFSPKISRFPTK